MATSDQYEKFKEAARSQECNEDEGAFEDKLRQIAKAKPKPADDKAKDEKAPE